MTNCTQTTGLLSIWTYILKVEMQHLLHEGR